TLVPGITELELAEISVGLRPGTPDNAPVIGPAGPDGVVVATGHYRNGVLLTPLTARAVADLVTGREPPAAVAPFGVARFSGALSR
ncbi:MAG TPA: FAD-dependent oxidoreductase, partial [Acidimicrobiales bacterium]|nr:FAD-dependent oxidoreductase [Acidimicrobiales bacterium]